MVYDDEFLNRYIDHLESDLEFWKDKYEVLQLEYYNQVRDSIKQKWVQILKGLCIQLMNQKINLS